MPSGDGTGIGSGTIVINGAGTVALDATNSFTGGVTIDSGTLLLGAPGAAGTGEIDFGASAPSFLQVSIAAAPTNTIGGFTFGDTIDVTDLAVTSPTILALGPGNVLDIPYDSGADTLALTFTSADDVGGFSIASDGSGGGDISFVLNTPPDPERHLTQRDHDRREHDQSVSHAFRDRPGDGGDGSRDDHAFERRKRNPLRRRPDRGRQRRICA
jgi:autotransporter-associated beta strand protein